MATKTSKTSKNGKTSSKKNGNGKAKKAAAKTSFSKQSNRKNRETMVIVSAETLNPRRAGTISHKNYAAMLRFTKGGKKHVPVVDVLTNTDYRIQDFNSDLAKGFVKVLRSKNAAQASA